MNVKVTDDRRGLPVEVRRRLEFLPAAPSSAQKVAVIVGFLALLTCQLVGQFAVDALDVPIPGPVVGMVLLLLILLLRKPTTGSGIVRAADALLRHLQLLFIPAGVGVIAYLDLIGAQWLPIVAGIVGSWFIALLVTAGVGAGVLRLPHRIRPTGRSMGQGE